MRDGGQKKGYEFFTDFMRLGDVRGKAFVGQEKVFQRYHCRDWIDFFFTLSKEEWLKWDFKEVKVDP